jgi:hypothetical protein
VEKKRVECQLLHSLNLRVIAMIPFFATCPSGAAVAFGIRGPLMKAPDIFLILTTFVRYVT